MTESARNASQLCEDVRLTFFITHNHLKKIKWWSSKTVFYQLVVLCLWAFPDALRIQKEVFCLLPSTCMVHFSVLMKIVWEISSQSVRLPRAETPPRKRNLTFNHDPSKLAALILASALPLAVFYICIFVCMCRVWAQHIRGCCCWAVMVVAPRVRLWVGVGLAVSALMVA